MSYTFIDQRKPLLYYPSSIFIVSLLKTRHVRTFSRPPECGEQLGSTFDLAPPTDGGCGELFLVAFSDSCSSILQSATECPSQCPPSTLPLSLCHPLPHPVVLRALGLRDNLDCPIVGTLGLPHSSPSCHPVPPTLAGNSCRLERCPT